MDQFLRDKSRDTLLFVNNIPTRSLPNYLKAITKLEKILDRKLKILIIAEKRDKEARAIKYPAGVKKITCNTNSIQQVERALKPYLDNIILMLNPTEKGIPYFRNIIPHVPYVDAPSQTSLDWASDKINMRRRLRVFNPKISPKYTIIEDSSKESIDKIITKVGFPCIVKPAGLAASVLVSVCYHEEELTDTLKKTLRKSKAVYKNKGRLSAPRILVEEFMEGSMYTTDIYVNNRGTMYTTPLVNTITGFSGGLEDFYGYKQKTPVTLKPHKHQPGLNVAKEAVEALGLKSITAHVELIRTEDGWKVVEVNARVGGFRHFLYENVYGIDHTLNDMLIRLPMRPIISRKAKGHAVVLKIYPRSEGVIRGIRGIKKMQAFSSYVMHDHNLQIGEGAYFARHGGGSVLNIYLFTKKRSDLLADIRRIEQTVFIDVSKKRSTAKDIPPVVANDENSK